jgi:uncharacterized membrane protein
MELITLTLFYLFAPLGILYLCRRFHLLNKLGAIFIAYIIGIIIGNLGILPEESSKVQDLTTMLTIPLAIPLLLFSSNIQEWGKLAKVTFLSFLFGVLAVIVAVIAGFFIFKSHGLTDTWKISGMLIGVYTGGTPNLASLKLMLNVDHETYLLAHTYDMAVSVVYLVFLMTIGQRFFHFLLRPFSQNENKIDSKEFEGSVESYKGMLSKKILLPLLSAFGIAILIFAISGGLSLLVEENQQMIVVMLTITTLSIFASMIKFVNRIEKTFEAGMYLILIFSIVVASMADISRFTEISFGLLGYISLAIFGSLLLHSIISKIFRIDADTMMITSTSLICSPLFVPAIAAAIGNKRIIVSGLTVGIIGYAIGNYLGLVVAEFLKAFN